jgi:hypothetical protein
MPSWSQIIPDEEAVGEKVRDMEQFAAKLEAVNPSPGTVSWQTSMMLATLSHGNEECLEKLRIALLRSDLGSMVKALEDLSEEPHNEKDLQFLRKAYEADDQLAISHALRRLAGDEQAGLDNDEYKEFDGKGYVRRDHEGTLERMPFLEEQASATNMYELCNCYKSVRHHNSSHIQLPAIMPKNEFGARTFTVMSTGEEWDVEGKYAFSFIEANIANANGDLLTGVVDPESGSLVMSMVGGDQDAEAQKAWAADATARR